MVVLDFDLMLTAIEKICEHLPVNFFLFTHHTNTSWKSAPVSFNVLSSISEMTRLCCSINSLLDGDSVALAMFIDSNVHWLAYLKKFTICKFSTIVSKEFSRSISSTKIGNQVRMIDVKVSKDTFADGLIERTSSMLDEKE